jgi:diacylglycerol kinase (ATP)
MKETIRKHQISFSHAFAGVLWALKTQPNFRIHITLAVLALLLGFLLGITETEMIVLVFTIILGLTGEMINTCIEAMTDLITQEWRADAKIAKDVGAGMMLITAVGTVLIAIIIFLPRILVVF